MTDSPPPPAAPQPAAQFTAADDKQYSTLATFLNIIPLIPALIFYFGFKDRGPMIREQSKENLNWTMNVTGILIADAILQAIFGFIPYVGFIIGILLVLVYWAVLVLNLIFSIIGGVRLSAGQTYRYPINVRWIK